MEKSHELVTVSEFQPVVVMVLNALTSQHSKRAYGSALVNFLAWWDRGGRAPMSKATVQAYRAELVESGVSPSTINLALSAIRKLAAEAADNGLLDPVLAGGIARVHGTKQAGVRSGNWLTKSQAQDLINAPDVSKLKGLRDRAILCVQVGAGLRRSEVAALTFEHVQLRDARWVIVDLVGKGGRVRTVPIPTWCKVALDAWTEAAGITSGRLFRGMDKGGHLTGEPITSQVVYRVSVLYLEQLSLPGAAHDLRRTFARLAHRGGAALEQIQLTLGHASLKTTERYLGVQQNLTDAPCDRLGLDLSGD